MRKLFRGLVLFLGSFTESLELNSTYMNDYVDFTNEYSKNFSYEKLEIFKENTKLIHEIKEELLSKNEVITTKLISVIEKLSKEKLYEQDTGDYSVESHIFDYGGALRLSLLVFIDLVERFKELEE